MLSIPQIIASKGDHCLGVAQTHPYAGGGGGRAAAVSAVLPRRAVPDL